MSATALLLQNVPPAPGRQGGGATKPGAAAPVTQSAQGQAADPTGEQAPPAGGGFAAMLPLLVLVPLLLVMVFSSRSQKKKQLAAVEGLKKGDRVLTQFGLLGKLVEIGDRQAKIEVAPGVKVEVLKTALVGKDTPENAAEVTKNAKTK